MRIFRSKAPLRLGLGGGASDLPEFVRRYGGSVINATINKYVYATLVPRPGEDILTIRSADYNATINYNSLKMLPYDGNLDLVKAVINKIKNVAKIDSYSGELFIRSDAPPGAGLGTSSTVVVAVLGVFLEALNLHMNSYDIAKLAWEIERVDMGLAGGYQDQYAAVFGGINFMEFHKHGTVIVNPLRIGKTTINEIQNNIILCYTGMIHQSEKIIQEQIPDTDMKFEYISHIKKISTCMKEDILTSDLRNFGELLSKEWSYKKQLSPNATNERLEHLEKRAYEAGALGLKITGAGGGGMFIIYSAWRKKKDVIEMMQSLGCQIWDFTITKTGLETWSVEE